MSTMAEIQDDIGQVLAEWENPDLSTEKLEELEARLAVLIESQTVKVDGIAQYFKMQTAMADACKEEAKRLNQKAKSIEARLDWLRYHYLMTMKQHGIQKIKGDAYTLSIRKSQAVRIDDMELLQKEAPKFVVEKVEYSPNKIAIKEAIKSGDTVPGASLVENESLQIR